MATAPLRTDRWTAVTLLAMAAVLPAGILFLYLFITPPVDYRHRLDVAMEPEGGARLQFILMSVGVVISSLTAGIIAFSKHPLVLRAAFALAVALALSYAAMGMWLLLFVSALPLWWAHKVAS